jgi:hypothetical protein
MSAPTPQPITDWLEPPSVRLPLTRATVATMPILGTVAARPPLRRKGYCAVAARSPRTVNRTVVARSLQGGVARSRRSESLLQPHNPFGLVAGHKRQKLF